MKIIDKIDNALAKVESLIVMVLMSVMVIIVSLQVLNQSFLHLDFITWTEEISRILLVWTLMVGSCMAVRRGSHLSVDFVYESLKGNAKFICRMCVLAVCIFITGYVCRSGIYMVMVQAKRGNFFGITHLPLWVASAAVPVCCAEMCFRYILILVREAMAFRNKGKGEAAC